MPSGMSYVLPDGVCESAVRIGSRLASGGSSPGSGSGPGSGGRISSGNSGRSASAYACSAAIASSTPEPMVSSEAIRSTTRSSRAVILFNPPFLDHEAGANEHQHHTERHHPKWHQAEQHQATDEQDDGTHGQARPRRVGHIG